MKRSSTVLSTLLDDIEKFGSLNGFDLFDRLSSISVNAVSGFPPTNLIQTDANSWTIEVALAGFKKDQIEVTEDQKKLIIKSSDQIKEESDKEDPDAPPVYQKYPAFIKKSIAKRAFKLSYDLPDYAEVRSAKFEDGLLTITVARPEPEVPAAKLIPLK